MADEIKLPFSTIGSSTGKTSPLFEIINEGNGPTIFAGGQDVAVVGVTSGETILEKNALGQLGGKDPTFHLFAGVYGESRDNGIVGETGNNTASGVFGHNTGAGTGVGGSSDKGTGVVGLTVTGVAVLGENRGTGLAGKFSGNVEISGGNLSMLNGADIRLADFSEDFDVSDQEELEPGTVVVLDHEGLVRKSGTAYDRKVAGVVSGAGDFRPAITLDRQSSEGHRISIALMGKVYCKVDAQYSEVAVGDLLTTSPTPGHAMKADDPLKAFGSVIGKALRPLQTGQGLVPVLVALQ
jgi:hypothetical protein